MGEYGIMGSGLERNGGWEEIEGREESETRNSGLEVKREGAREQASEIMNNRQK
jgi:hypothetical protein